MDLGELFSRMGEHLSGRVTGPMTFRFYLQPAMAAIAAIKAGLRDAHEGRPPYFWFFLQSRGQRKSLAKEGWKDIGRVFLLGVGMDWIYQVAFLKGFFPLEALIVAAVLAIVPYLLLRGIVTRLARRRLTDESAHARP